jgi:Kef-type K+ transport system membrane component KefB
MSATHAEIPVLDRNGLRKFGLTTGATVVALFGLLIPLAFGLEIPPWPWVLCGALFVFALLIPSALGPVYWVWMRFGLIMSRITTPIILSIVFYLVFTPISLIRTLISKDSMARGFDQKSPSYRVPSHQPQKNNLERPY